jgi:acyl-CoA dehydrogenase
MACEWAATRKAFGKTIGEFQGTSFKLADMAMEIRLVFLTAMDCARKMDQGTLTRQEASMCNLFGSEMVGRVTDNAIRIFGGIGVMEELPIQRFWRDSRIERIWEGTSEIHRDVIAHDILKEYWA